MIKLFFVSVLILSNYPQQDSPKFYKIRVEISNSQKLFISQNCPDSCINEFNGCWNIGNSLRTQVFSTVCKGGYNLEKEKDFFIVEKYSWLHEELYGTIWNEKFIYDYRFTGDSLFIETINKNTSVTANTASVSEWTHFVGNNLRNLYNQKHKKLKCGELQTPHMGTHVAKISKNHYNIFVKGFYSN
jgi:hypothetical protein